MNIAVDGPAGAGKSTIAKAVAKKLGIIYVDTGAMYRAIALYMIENNISSENDAAIGAACENISIRIAYENETQQVYLNDKNVSAEIRMEQVGNMASVFSAKQVVRSLLLDMQRDIAAENDCIMDGRDIGTNVLPNAELKIYLTASADTRATRRYRELLAKGETPDLDKIRADIEQRDYQDMHREIAPLKQAEDAVYLDTSDMSIQEVVMSICDMAEKIKGN